MLDWPDIRQLSSPLTPEQLRPLDPRCRVVQFDQPLSQGELRRVAAFLDEYPSVALRVYGYRTYATLDFLEAFGRLRNIQVDIFELEDATGLRFLRPDLLFFGFGATRKRHSLAPLSRLTDVEDLWLEGHTKDLDVVSDLRTLRRLSLRSIRLPGLAMFHALSRLECLELKLGSMTDLRDLPRVGQLRRLEAWLVRGLADVEAVAAVPSLETLFLQSLRRVTALPPLSCLPALKRVHLETMKSLTDLSPVAKAPALEELLVLDMRHLEPETFAPFVGHPTLRRLNVGLGSTRKNKAVRSLLPLPPTDPEVVPHLARPLT